MSATHVEITAPAKEQTHAQGNGQEDNLLEFMRQKHKIWKMPHTFSMLITNTAFGLTILACIIGSVAVGKGNSWLGIAILVTMPLYFVLGNRFYYKPRYQRAIAAWEASLVAGFTGGRWKPEDVSQDVFNAYGDMLKPRLEKAAPSVYVELLRREMTLKAKDVSWSKKCRLYCAAQNLAFELSEIPPEAWEIVDKLEDLHVAHGASANRILDSIVKSLYDGQRPIDADPR